MIPALSIIVTTHKRNHYLEECLDSIFESVNYYRSQIIKSSEPIEIIVTDDYPLQSREFIDKLNTKYIGKDLLTSFKYHVNEQNQGDYFNRNIGINIAQGDWVKFIDDDDIIYQESIALILSAINGNLDSNVNTMIFYIRDNFRHLKFPLKLTSTEILDFHYKYFGLFHCSLVSSVFRRNNENFKEGFLYKRFYGDFYLLNKLALTGKFVVYPFELGFYRIHDNQESGFNRKYDAIRFNYLLISINLLNEGGYLDRYKGILIKDNFVYFKRGIKTVNLKLIFQTLQLHYFISLKKINDSNHNWKSYLNKNLLSHGNTIKD